MFHIIRSMWPKIHTADGEVNALFLGKEKQINKKKHPDFYYYINKDYGANASNLARNRFN